VPAQQSYICATTPSPRARPLIEIMPGTLKIGTSGIGANLHHDTVIQPTLSQIIRGYSQPDHCKHADEYLNASFTLTKRATTETKNSYAPQPINPQRQFPLTSWPERQTNPQQDSQLRYSNNKPQALPTSAPNPSLLHPYPTPTPIPTPSNQK
jgi:hypothetical protein